MRIRTVQIRGFRAIRSLDLDFGADPPRFVAIVGPNGSGKTSILEAIAQAVYFRLAGSPAPGWPAAAAVNVDVDGVKVGVDRGVSYGSKPGTWLYVPTGRDPRLPIRPTIAAGTGTGPLSPPAALAGSDPSQDIHAWIVHRQLTGGAPELWSAVEAFLAPYRFAGIDPATHDVRFDTPHGTIGFQQLSMGQRAMVLLLAEIARQCAPDGIVLIDEPEAHLHPTWQRRIRGALGRLLPDGQAIVATHSPFIVDGIPANELIVLGSIDEPEEAA